jgi:hypothetical protein
VCHRISNAVYVNRAHISAPEKQKGVSPILRLRQHNILILYDGSLVVGRRPHALLGAGSRVARGQITVNGIPKFVNYCEIFILHAHLTNVAAGRGLR